MRFAICPLHLSKVLRLPRKSDARSYEVLHLSPKVILGNLAPKCNLFREISAQTSEYLWWACLSYCACHATCIFPDPLQMSHACHRFWTCYKKPHVLLTFDNVHNPLHLPHQTTSERPKAVRDRQFLTLLTSKRASRHNDISTSKSASELLCFVHFDFDMCIAPQRRALFRHLNCAPTLVRLAHFDFQMCFVPQRCALFRHLNFQKCSEPGVFCTFWLRNVLRATMACAFFSHILPHGSAPAALASLLLDPPEPQITGKTQCFATLVPFRAPASSVFSLFLCSDLLFSSLLWLFPPLLFHLYCQKFDA